MHKTMLSIHPRERLACAMEMLRGAQTVADIGCDHGRLSCALVQQGFAERCIAVDISAPSLKKAEQLAERVGVADRVETRLGDGLQPVQPGEADAIAILGVGGTLTARMLEAVDTPLNGAKRCVLQPMRAVDDIRTWLFERNYPVLSDRVVFEGGRYYQVFSVSTPQPERQAMPDGWPEDCFFLGYKAFESRDPLMTPMVKRMHASVNRRLKTQKAEELIRQAAQLEQILNHLEMRQ
jgi:tRNA (adenine22-N1)-methyltransferase